MSYSQDHIDYFSKKLITYVVLYQTCSDRLQKMEYNEKIYDKANEEWQRDSSNPLFEPPVNDAEKRAAFFAKCDEICQSKPKTASDYCKIGFACWAGINHITHQLLPSQIIGNVHRLASVEYCKQNPNVPVLPDSPDDMNPKLPAHLAAAIFPDWTQREVVEGTEIGAQIIDQTIPFIDQETGEISECTIHDHGTSHIRGEWYEVTYGGTAEPYMISSMEMEEIITNRVQEDIV